MPTSTSGGPSINTGNAAWDQGLGSIFGGLFPDPSRVAQAGYYGAEQRNKQLQSSRLRDQMAHQQAVDAAAGTLTMPTTSYAPSPEGPNMTPIMQPPGAYVPVQAPPAAAPPSLGTTVAAGAGGGPASAPAPAAPPVAPAPIVAGQVGANMAPGGLSSLFAQGGGAVAPAGGGTMRLDQGTPPPTSSPAPGAGAPPASNATASDGSVPNNDTTSGIFHPGSITPPGGGRKTSGPANADGSPAKPMITAAQYVALAVGAGHEANQALLEWRSMISSAYDTGRIDENTYHHMMGAAEPSIITTDATNAANIKRTGMEQAGQNQREAMSQAGQDRRVAPVFVPDEERPGTGTYTPPSVINQSGGTRGGSPTPLSQDQTAAMIQRQIANEPDPAKRAQLIQRYQAASPRPPPEEKEVYAARAMNYQSDAEAYPTPQKPPVAFHITAPIAFKGDAQAKIDERTQELMDQNRRLDMASAHRQAVFQLQADGTLYSPDDVSEMRQGTAANLYGRYDAQIQNYAPPGGKPSEHLMLGLKPKSGGQKQQQQQQPTQTSPPPTATTTPPPAATPPGPAYRSTSEIFGSGGGPPTPGTTPGPAPQPWLVQKLTPQTTPTGPAPMSTQQMYGGVPTAPAAAAPMAATPAAPQPIGRAAPNAQDGSIAYLNGRPVGIVRGGAVYPMPAGPGGGG